MTGEQSAQRAVLWHITEMMDLPFKSVSVAEIHEQNMGISMNIWLVVYLPL